ncbi:uncharacterized protein KY384_002268 [Bacidia gigantensis]|uniref:uncharacterized protein n=1 Tax=Bacidia gigantensis TaxID=2732470 RepID=UPI001D03641A|nr:uncharacterized protein KY384_002268 [Bacidia gigantensis]KAG8533485.1 hypothetical protein KY384_002268 [Bacidia gigantensis]
MGNGSKWQERAGERGQAGGDDNKDGRRIKELEDQVAEMNRKLDLLLIGGEKKGEEKVVKRERGSGCDRFVKEEDCSDEAGDNKGGDEEEEDEQWEEFEKLKQFVPSLGVVRRFMRPKKAKGLIDALSRKAKGGSLRQERRDG